MKGLTRVFTRPAAEPTNSSTDLLVPSRRLVLDLQETRLSTVCDVVLATRLIHSAATEGDVDQLRRLLTQGADVNLRDPSDSSSTPLHKAARCGHVEATSLLLQFGALPSLRNDYNATPLQVAKQLPWSAARFVRMGDWEKIIEVLEESQVATKAAASVAVAASPSVAPDSSVLDQVRLASADVRLSILRMLLADPSVVPAALSITALRLESKLGAQSDGVGDLPGSLIQLPMCCVAPRKTPSGLHRGYSAPWLRST